MDYFVIDIDNEDDDEDDDDDDWCTWPSNAISICSVVCNLFTIYSWISFYFQFPLAIYQSRLAKCNAYV